MKHATKKYNMVATSTDGGYFNYKVMVTNKESMETKEFNLSVGYNEPHGNVFKKALNKMKGL